MQPLWPAESIYKEWVLWNCQFYMEKGVPVELGWQLALTQPESMLARD